MPSAPKNPPLRDRAWLDHLHSERCVITGQFGNATETIDPMHISTAGKAIKSGDDRVIPVLHRFHAEAHQSGEITMLRKHAPDSLLRAAFQALGEKMYREWKEAR